MKMGWMKFLKPDWRKILITIALSLILILSFRFSNTPLQYLSISLYPLIPESCAPGSEICQQTFNWFVIPSWLFMYILSCLIVWIYDKVKKK